MKTTLLFTAILLSTVTANLANIADPSLPKKKSIDTQLCRYLDRNAKEARLVIPRSQLKQLRAELEGLDSDAPTTAGPAVTRTQTIVSGGLLSLAFLFACIWFLLSGSQHCILCIAAAVLLARVSFARLVFGIAGARAVACRITG
jgi:hypothetical protein